MDSTTSTSRCPRPTASVIAPRVCAANSNVCSKQTFTCTHCNLLITLTIISMCSVCSVCSPFFLLTIYTYYLFKKHFLLNLEEEIDEHTAHINVYAACSSILPAHIAAHIAAHTPVCCTHFTIYCIN